MVVRTRDGDRGYDVITPFHTEVNAKTGGLQGIFVNRGRIPIEYKDSKIHHNTSPNVIMEIEGVLNISEGADRLGNEPTEVKDDTVHNHIRIDCQQFIQRVDLENKE